MYSTAALPITEEQRLEAGASAYLMEAGDILNPGPTLLKLIEGVKTTLSSIDNPVTKELLALAT
jgi:hypothetical protein